MTFSGDQSPSLLGGVRILELSSIVAGPLAAALLGDFGAEVIKVEPPEGDAIRLTGPKKGGSSLRWKVSARNKKNITLNLRERKGQEICKRLAAKSDVLIETFRPGTLEKWNLGWEDLKQVNPALIMLRISGYGQTGPYSPRPGFGKAAEAMSGVMQITGFPDQMPISPGFSFADTVSGLTGAFAIMMALYHRDGLRRKTGQVIDVALFESLYRLIEWQTITFDQLGIIAQRNGARMAIPETTGLVNNYITRDNKWVAVSASSRPVLNRVLKLVGGEALLNDERFNQKQIVQHMDQLDELVRGWIKERDREEVIRLFVEADAVAAPIYDVKDIFEDPHYAERGDIISVEDEELGKVRMLGVTPKFPAMPGKVRWAGKAPGSFNQEIYGKLLNMTTAEMESLKKEGII